MESALYKPGMEPVGPVARTRLDPFRKMIKATNGIERGQSIGARRGLEKGFTVLLEGVACLSTQHINGDRHIHVFYYPGDFIGLHSFIFPQSAELSEVQSLTNCSIGTIDRDVLDKQIERDPALGRALWGAAMMEAGVIRRRLFIARRPALERIAHLLCEVLAGLGIDEGVIPLTQIDVADAAGLSVVHTNRIFQELRQLGVLSRQRIEVLNGKGLRKLAGVDGLYLDLRETLSRWDLRFEN